jgi:hypothetical protein
MALAVFLLCLPNEPALARGPTLLRFLVLSGDQQAEVYWETRKETDIIGFILLRSEGDSAGNFIEAANYLRDSALVAKGTQGRYSRRYSWMDRGLVNGIEYWYHLELVDERGEQESYGPVAAMPTAGSSIYQAAETLGWEWQNPLPTGTYPRDVDFVDADYGWIVGESNTILRTTDGGRSWKLLDPGLGLPKMAGTFAPIRFQEVKFFDQHTGLVTGCIYGPESGTSGQALILKTYDGGETWRPTFLRPGHESPTIFFLNSSNGWASFPPEGIFATADGGDSWEFAGPYPPSFVVDTLGAGVIWSVLPIFRKLFLLLLILVGVTQLSEACFLLQTAAAVGNAKNSW